MIQMRQVTHVQQAATITNSVLPLAGWFLLALHVPVAFVIHRSPLIATAHGLLTIALSVGAAVRLPVHYTLYAAAYITGCEVLWRMSNARLPWEYAKYSIVVLSLIALVRLGRRGRWVWPPLVFAALLIPSTGTVMMDPDVSLRAAAKQVSFALSGPIALAALLWLSSQLALEERGLHRVFLSFLAPVLGVATIAMFTTFGEGPVRFTGESNFATSGGFGPNQVSTMLGLGALVAFLACVTTGLRARERVVLGSIAIALLAQAVMTFSRGGVLAAVISAGGAVAVLAMDRQARGRALGLTLVVALVLGVAVIPRLDSFTGGKLSARYRETGTTGRGDLMRSDLEIWQANPLFGIGPGQAKKHREGSKEIAGHTEYTQLLAEHGALGLAALGLLLAMCIARLVAARSHAERALVLALFAWSIMTMYHAAMRLAAPGFIYALACAGLPGNRRAAAAQSTTRNPLPSARARVA